MHRFPRRCTQNNHNKEKPKKKNKRVINGIEFYIIDKKAI
jgi:hypothetical protein